MNRAYAVLELKSVNEELWQIEGIATTPRSDRADDIVEPLGAKFQLPLAFLWQHAPDAPVGHVVYAKPTKEGIPFKVQLVRPDMVESVELKERLQLAWDSFKTKLVRAVSIGFRILKYEVMQNGGYRFIEWEWLELSGVTIPMNADATINVIRSIDSEALALSGNEQPAEIDLTGAKLVPATPPAKVVHVAKLAAPARGRADPFVIRKIKHTV